MSKIHGQSTKESYRDDIESSRKHKTVYKMYEYFDDYSYGKSDKIGWLLEKEDDEYYAYFFQKDGPSNIETLKKLLEWRRSGKSDEIGHKGGGNKRNIYGYKALKVDIIKRLDDSTALTCSTKPNGLYELSTSDINEDEFRKLSDSSLYIMNPEKQKIKNLPAWYNIAFNKIKEEFDIVPNYMIRMELTELPEEFCDAVKWGEMLNQISAKQ